MVFDVVVNPAGASGRTGKEFERILPKLQGYGHEIRVHYSTREHGVEEIVREITGQEREVRLVLMGGDGTLNEAVNGICDPDRVAVGLLIAGSGNDFARSIGLENDKDKLINEIMRGEVRRSIDIGQITYHDRYVPDPLGQGDKTPLPVETGEPWKRRFMISAGLGFDAKACYEVSISRLKAILNKVHLGKLVYIMAAMKAIFGAPRTAVTLRLLDGTTKRYDHTLLAVAMNEIYEGGGFAFCPKADDADGILDVCVADPARSAVFFRAFPSVYSGKHYEKFPKIIHGCRSEKIDMTSEQPLWVHTDGETPYMSTHVTMEILPKKLRLMV